MGQKLENRPLRGDKDNTMLLRLAYPMKIVTKVKRWCIWWLELARVSDCVRLQWMKKQFKQLKQNVGHHFPSLFLSPLSPPFPLTSLHLFLTLTHHSLTTFHSYPLPTSLPLLPQKHSEVGHVFNQTFWHQM